MTLAADLKLLAPIPKRASPQAAALVAPMTQWSRASGGQG
jgi:hypothetical protein